MMKRILVGFILLAVLRMTGTGISEKRLTFTAVADSPDASASEKVLKEAYRLLGIEITFERQSAQEALRRSNAGEVDGEVQRIDGISKKYAHLVQVPIPINYIQGAVFSKKRNLELTGWHSLRPYRIGLVKGILFAEMGTRDMNTVSVTNYNELIDSILTDQVDVMVVPYINGLVAIQQHPKGHELQLNGILESYLLYHYLHEEHKDLAPAITKVLKRMLLDGTVSEMRRETIRELVGETEP